jgi:putative ABC transport system permease protein
VFFRLLMESFRRQRRRKMLAGLAILLGTTAVTAMLALATTIGDRIHQELAVYGANIVVFPKADLLDVKVGGVDVKPASGGVYLKESDLEKLKGIFWANNITGLSPELSLTVDYVIQGVTAPAPAVGLWFHHPLNDSSTVMTGAPEMHSWWKITGAWPTKPNEIVLGQALAAKLGYAANIAPKDRSLTLVDPRASAASSLGDLRTAGFDVVGIVATGDETENKVLMPLGSAQSLIGVPGAVRRVDVSARTKPEDAFARKDPDSLSPKQREIWYCRPYANSIAYQIREAIPGAQAEQVRRVEQSEGNVLARISGLMWLVSAAALLAAGFAVSAAMATAVLERRGEIGLMRSLGASKGAIALLFYSETGLLAVFSGALGYLIGSGLAAWLGARIFAGDGAGVRFAVLNPVLLPVVVALALVVAIAGSTPSIRAALRMDPSAILRADA